MLYNPIKASHFIFKNEELIYMSDLREQMQVTKYQAHASNYKKIIYKKLNQNK